MRQDSTGPYRPGLSANWRGPATTEAMLTDPAQRGRAEPLVTVGNVPVAQPSPPRRVQSTAACSQSTLLACASLREQD